MTTGWTDIAAKGWVRIRVDGHDTIVPPDAGGHFTATVTVELAGTTVELPETDR